MKSTAKATEKRSRTVVVLAIAVALMLLGSIFAQMFNTSFYKVKVSRISFDTDSGTGKSRPVHFRGVQTVVLKLFHIVTPDRAYFGQKDAQQLAVIRRMVKDLNVDTRIIGCPIIREDDGLAKSSRNTYLNGEERQAALVLNRSLKAGKALVDAGETRACVIKSAITAEIEKEPLARIDYVDVVDFDTITPVEKLEGSILVAIAVYIGKTRLIDNFIVEK